ncbi:YcnI family protein [Plantactinospora sp. KBS50]|uniref:YcnI family protein n=1 Tax=Plantactinospora sp. KBS50 TaxID=2024580 RepID=UPI000BAAB92A|nr:YcnI family protein [Plantactinospora sp. KBS50]ASW54837.1 hypothetical protein CIK06_12550 [Plantactinospora sp. KBS50]
MNRSIFRRAAVVSAAATVAAVFGLAGSASAHVTVNPNTATQGGYTKVSFRVPNESDSASTTKVEVNLPTDTPIASVSLKPLAGWTAVTTKSKLETPIKTDDGEITEAITKITWTADSGADIKPGQFQEFDVSLGPLPQADQVVFKALQTYSDDSIVRWIDEPSTDGSEVEHPAPVLKLAAKAADAPASSAPASAAAEASDEAADSGSGAGLGWGIAGLVVAVGALVLALLAYRRGGQTPAA